MRNLIYLFIALIMLNACEPETTAPTDSTDINKIIRDAGVLNKTVMEEEREISSSKDLIDENGIKYERVKKKYKLSKNLSENMIVANPNANTLWAGALVQGKDVPSGVLSSIGDNLPRTAITLTVNSISSSKNLGNLTLDVPNNANYSSKLTELINKNSTSIIQDIPAEMKMETAIAYSSKQAMMELGINFGAFGQGFSASFQTNNSSQKQTMFLYFKQKYYTVSTNEFAKPSDFFNKNLDLDDLAYKVNSTNPLCYVSSVDYGRIILAKLEYTGSIKSTEFKAKAEGIFSKLLSGEAVNSNEEIVQNSTFSAYILGGSASNATKALNKNFEGMKELIQEKADLSTAAPIGYVVKNAADNSTVKIGDATEYEIYEYTLSKENFMQCKIDLLGFYILNDCDPDFDGDFYYNLNISSINNNYGIEQLVLSNSLDRKQSIEAGDLEGVDIVGIKSTEFTIVKHPNSFIRFDGKLSEANSLVPDIHIPFNVTFKYPFSDTEMKVEMINGIKYATFDLIRDSGCNAKFYFKYTFSEL